MLTQEASLFHLPNGDSSFLRMTGAAEEQAAKS
jgi:hypothetical protein